MSLLYLLPLRSRRLLEFLLKNVSFYRKRDVKVGISTWSQRSTKRAYPRLPNNVILKTSILLNKKSVFLIAEGLKMYLGCILDAVGSQQIILPMPNLERPY